jgi:P4 family phage/plasmid primase-like protien
VPTTTERELWISEAAHRRAPPTVRPTTWAELSARLTKFTVTSESFDQYLAAGNAQLDIKDVGWWVGGWFTPAVRRRENLKGRSVLSLDIDHLPAADWQRLLDTYQRWAYVLHSSHKHVTTEPRLRLVMPFTRDVHPFEYEPIGRAVASWFGMDPFDDTGFQVSRVMFWPSRSVDGDEWSHCNPGEWLDPDAVLAGYAQIGADWQDFAAWPTSSRAELKRAPGTVAEDPYTKPGVIGAFNRAFEIPHAIVEFELPYVPSGLGENRWTYTGGTSIDGAIYYEDDGHLYSWHESDPARGNHNAWDLVRVHRFGHLDARHESAPIHQRPSQRAMSAWAASIPIVAQELASESGFTDVTAAATATAPAAEQPPGALALPGVPGAAPGEVAGTLAAAAVLTYEQLRGEIEDHANGDVGITNEVRKQLVTRIAAARLQPAEVSILAGLLRGMHLEPKPSKQAILEEIKIVGKQLVGMLSADGSISDIEMDLIEEVLREHYNGGEYIRRVGRQYWTFHHGVWRRADDEIVHGKLTRTLVRLRMERPESAMELAAAVGETKTSTLSGALNRLMDRVIAERHDQADPLGLTTQKPPIMNCRNGELHFDRDGSAEFLPHHPELFLTSQIPVAYDPAATCPEWDHFCGMIFADASNPAEMQRHLEELGGYVIQFSRWLKTWVLFHGATNAGKTTIGRIFERMLGNASVSRPVEAYDGSNSHAESGLVGKLMLLDEDFAKGAILPDGFIKKISEAKTITANPKGKDEFDFISLALPIVIANHWPPTRDVSDAFRERALVFDLQTQIPAAARSDARADRMLNEELPGILNRFVAGFQRLRARGRWDPPVDCESARVRWISRADSARMWAAECVTPAAEGFLRRSDVHAHYAAWLRLHNPASRPLGRSEFLDRIIGFWGPPAKRNGAIGWAGLAFSGGEDEMF